MYPVLCMAFIETSFEVVPLKLPREIKLLCHDIYLILVFTLFSYRPFLEKRKSCYSD